MRKRFGADPDRIFVGGTSAGGHITGMVLAGGWHDDFGVPPDCVKGALALNGLYDLQPVRLSEPNEWAKLDEAAARRNSPIHYLPEQGCPMIVSYGGSETAEFKRQSNIYAAAWRERGLALFGIRGHRMQPFQHSPTAARCEHAPVPGSVRDDRGWIRPGNFYTKKFPSPTSAKLDYVSPSLRTRSREREGARDTLVSWEGLRSEAHQGAFLCQSSNYATSISISASRSGMSTMTS